MTESKEPRRPRPWAMITIGLAVAVIAMALAGHNPSAWEGFSLLSGLLFLILLPVGILTFVRSVQAARHYRRQPSGPSSDLMVAVLCAVVGLGAPLIALLFLGIIAAATA